MSEATIDVEKPYPLLQPTALMAKASSLTTFDTETHKALPSSDIP